MKRLLMIFALVALFGACSPVEYDSSATLTGTVVDDGDQSPIGGVSITLMPTSISAYTDAGGCFQFVDLEARTYTIQAQKTGYDIYREDVTLNWGASENRVIHMKKK